jgi:hypothetical protein
MNHRTGAIEENDRQIGSAGTRQYRRDLSVAQANIVDAERLHAMIHRDLSNCAELAEIVGCQTVETANR